MTRARFSDVALNTTGRPITDLTVTVLEPGTATLIAAPLYAAATGVTTRSNPFTTNGDGDIEFWLDAPAIVDVQYTKVGLETETHTVVVDSASVPLDQKGVPGGVATLDGAGFIPLAQLPSAAALDAEVAAAVAAAGIVNQAALDAAVDAEAALRAEADDAEAALRAEAVAAEAILRAEADDAEAVLRAEADDAHLVGHVGADATLVHLAGTETITGAKTFTVPTTLNDAVVVGFDRFNAALLSIDTLGASNIGMVIRGRADQIADLQQWQNSVGTVLAKISGDGTLTLGTGGLYTTQGQFRAMSGGGRHLFAGNLTMQGYLVVGSSFDGDSGAALFVLPTDATRTVIVTRGFASQTGDLQQWQDSTGAVKSAVAANGSIVLPTIEDIATRAGPYIGLTGSVINVVNRNAVGNIPLVVNGMAGQTGALQQWKDSAGTAVAQVFPDGAIAAPILYGRVSGTGIENTVATGPYIDLQPTAVMVINRTAVGNVPFIVRGMAAQTGDLAQWRNSADAPLVRINSAGDIVTKTGMGVGDAGYLTASLSVKTLDVSVAGIVVRALPSQSADLQQWQPSEGFVGWSGAELKADGSFKSKGGSFEFSPYGVFMFGDTDGGGIRIEPRAASLTGLRVKGLAAQTGTLQEWQDSAGVLLARIGADGNLAIRPSGTGVLTLGDGTLSKGPGAGFAFNTGLSAQYVGVNASASTAQRFVVQAGAVGDIPAIVKGFAGQTGDLQQWQNSAASVLAKINPAGNLMIAFVYNSTGTRGIQFSDGAAGALVFGGAADKILVVRGAASQTANLQEWQNSAGGAVASLTPAGVLYISDTLASGGSQIILTHSVEQAFRAVRATAWTDSVNASFFQIGPATPNTGGAVFQASLGAALPRLMLNGKTTLWDGSYGTAPIPSNMVLLVAPASSGTLGMVLRGAASQTANLTEWQNSAGTALSKITAAGEPEVVTAGAGMILKSPNGTRYRVTVDDDGALVTAAA